MAAIDVAYGGSAGALTDAIDVNSPISDDAGSIAILNITAAVDSSAGQLTAQQAAQSQADHDCLVQRDPVLSAADLAALKKLASPTDLYELDQIAAPPAGTAGPS